MFIKLALNNIKKSYKDYLIYFLTIAFAIALFYLFNSMAAQQKLMKADYISKTAMSMLGSAMSYVSVAVTGVLAFLMVYANQFLIKRRKKELGIYITLGMSRIKLSYVLVLETIIIGLISLFVGLCIGIFGSHLLAIVTAKIFNVEMRQFQFVISLDGILKACFYFGCIFLLVMVFNIYNVNRIRLIKLINGDRMQTPLKIMHPKLAALILTFGLIFLAYAYHAIIENEFRSLDFQFQSSIICGIAGTILFFFSFSHMVMYAFKSQKKVYYRRLNAFSFKQISSKMRQTYLLISILCILLLIAMGTVCAGLGLVGLVEDQVVSPYDLNIRHYVYDDRLFDDILPEMKDLVGPYDQVFVYNLDMSPTLLFTEPVKEREFFIRMEAMTLSDFNTTRRHQGLDPVSLEADSYMYVSNQAKLLDAYGPVLSDLTIGDRVYTPQAYERYDYYNAYMDSTSLIILPDEVLIDKRLTSEIWILDPEDPRGLTEDLKLLQDKDFFFIDSREINTIQSLGTQTITAYVALYIGFVFIMTTVVCLSLQQLTDVSDHIKRYDLLIKLGVDKKQIKHSLQVQLLVYFLMPLGLAIVHSFVGIYAMQPMMRYLGQVNIWKYAGITGLLVMGVYAVYFVATYAMTSAIVFKQQR